MMDDLRNVHAPYWNHAVDLPSFLEYLASQMRRGDYTMSCEALVLTMDADTEIVTINRWGEPCGLLSEDSLLGVAKASRTT